MLDDPVFVVAAATGVLNDDRFEFQLFRRDQTTGADARATQYRDLLPTWLYQSSQPVKAGEVGWSRRLAEGPGDGPAPALLRILPGSR